MEAARPSVLSFEKLKLIQLKIDSYKVDIGVLF